MLLDFALFTLTGWPDRTGVRPEARLYDAERLTDMQSVLRGRQEISELRR